jgi:hypothetical protein
MAKVFAEAWGPAVRARDYGWFAKLEEGHADVGLFEDLSGLVQCVSPNESAFGQAKFDHVRNAQEGLCALGAHVATKMNRTFGKGSQWERLRGNKLLMLCAQHVIKARRAVEKVRVRAIEKKYEERKLATMEKNRGEGLKKSRMEFAKQWVLLDFADDLPLVAQYTEKMALTKGARQTVTGMTYDIMHYHALYFVHTIVCNCTVLTHRAHTPMPHPSLTHSHTLTHTHHTPYTHTPTL